MSNDLCEELNHIVFDSSDPEKHDQLQHGLSQWEKKNLVLEKRQPVTMETSVPQDHIGAAHKGWTTLKQSKPVKRSLIIIQSDYKKIDEWLN